MRKRRDTMLNNMRLVHYLQRIRQGKEVRLPEDQKRILELFIIKEGENGGVHNNGNSFTNIINNITSQ